MTHWHEVMRSKTRQKSNKSVCWHPMTKALEQKALRHCWHDSYRCLILLLCARVCLEFKHRGHRKKTNKNTLDRSLSDSSQIAS